MSAIQHSTRVGIIGGGPAGLMLSHLLSRAGIDNLVVEGRDRESIHNTHRAGILESGSVAMLRESGVDGRIDTLGDEHSGIDLRFGGESHLLDFRELVDATVTLYAQNEVFLDLSLARERDGGEVYYEATVDELFDVTSERPGFAFTDKEGARHEVRADLIVGADGSRSFTRRWIPEEARTNYTMEYPFAWFGILTEAPKSSPELIYARSDRGFALISQRSETVQRMYFQCSPETDVNEWSEERIWEELQARVAGPDGLELKTGPIFEKMVLPFRSFVRTPLRYGNLFLAGDAGHTVPPTGAKGLNLAFADVKVLFEAIDSWNATGSKALLDAYSDTALKRVWKAQHFSYWMTSMLHTRADATPFENARTLGELESVVSSEHGKRYLAEAYTGWPHA
ncbi:4-hydroxybenzoate 3-monooxygenase [Galactobacter valiniphilus]|uniref:4-hydroxybenzoate 3-monooxygenase n=1 Tax=Galactobacter valiniphilus TaxID=2676122 RepID=UPI0037367B66